MSNVGIPMLEVNFLKGGYMNRQRAGYLAIEAFLIRQSYVERNTTCSDGDSLSLFGNVIAKWINDDIWITCAGWPTRTTKDRLNKLGAKISHKKRILYKNNIEWDGKWIKL